MSKNQGTVRWVFMRDNRTAFRGAGSFYLRQSTFLRRIWVKGIAEFFMRLWTHTRPLNPLVPEDVSKLIRDENSLTVACKMDFGRLFGEFSSQMINFQMREKRTRLVPDA